MGVPCPRCGRQYDVTLFDFGRTLWCTCGSRVGRERRERPLAPGPGPRFLADAMLGRLARWLRLLGFDCAWEADVADEDLVRRGVEEGRIILSRDRALSEEWRVSAIHPVSAEDLHGQLAEVLGHFHLAPEIRLFSRCAECNEPLRTATPEEVAGRVPERILASQDAFAECPACGRVYWEGSHTDRIRRVVDRLLQEA